MHVLFNPAETKIIYNRLDTAQPYRIVNFSDAKNPKTIWFARTKEEAQSFFDNPIPFRNKVETQIEKFNSGKSVKV